MRSVNKAIEEVHIETLSTESISSYIRKLRHSDSFIKLKLLLTNSQKAIDFATEKLSDYLDHDDANNDHIIATLLLVFIDVKLPIAKLAAFAIVQNNIFASNLHWSATIANSFFLVEKLK